MWTGRAAPSPTALAFFGALLALSRLMHADAHLYPLLLIPVAMMGWYGGAAAGVGALTLSYVAASKLTLMLDNRVDIANSDIFAGTSGPNVTKTLFTTTLGAIIATK